MENAPKKRLIICMDGTWQNLAWQAMEIEPVTGLPLDRRTNVAKVAQLTKQHAKDGRPQIVFYSPGVGAREFVTRDKKKMRYEGATGEGAEESMIAAYMFLSFNYELGDDIMLFGFSRGAFCVRSLAGLIARCGILKRDCTAQVRNALDLYRRDNPHAPENIADSAKFREEYSVTTKIAGYDGVSIDDPTAIRITYMGVFETVVMRATSVFDLLKGESKEFRFHDLKLGNHVLSARHAMAIDENRNALPLKQWTNLAAKNRERGFDPAAPNAPFQQKWFVGAHGDVGGGESRELSEVSRKWVMRGACAVGLDVSEPLALEGGRDAPVFHKGEIEVIKTLRFPLLQTDRVIYPEAREPGDPAPEPEEITVTVCDRYLHVTSAMRVLKRSKERRKYRPRHLLRPFKTLFDKPDDPAFQQWLTDRGGELYRPDP